MYGSSISPPSGEEEEKIKRWLTHPHPAEKVREAPLGISPRYDRWLTPKLEEQLLRQ